MDKDTAVNNLMHNYGQTAGLDCTELKRMIYNERTLFMQFGNKTMNKI